MADDTCCGPGYASPEAAMRAPRERLLYTAALYTGTGVEAPDYLATVDVDPESETYSQVVHRTEMEGLGDELHHSGWNACSSCHGDASKQRRYLILPGVRTANLNVVDTARTPARPSSTRSSRARRSAPRRTSRAPTRSTAWAATSSCRCWATPRGTRRAGSCI